MGISVLSLFDGISCGMLALQRAKINVERYVAYEIDNNAIKVSKHHFSEIEQRGNVIDADFKEFNGFDLLIGGSPCQDLCNLGSKDGLKGMKSKLFYEYVRAIEEVKPKYFLLENNASMSKASKNKISEILGCEPILINSATVSAQNRKRLYWTNLPNVTQPEDKGILLKDILDTDLGYIKKFKVNRTASRERMWNNGQGKNNLQSCRNITNAEKASTISTKQDRAPNAGLIEFEDFCRYLTIHEQERLQTLPVGYTDCLNKKIAQEKCIGNGWTVDVIAHILEGLSL